MTALRGVIPRVAACEPGSSAPRYASVSTMRARCPLSPGLDDQHAAEKVRRDRETGRRAKNDAGSARAATRLTRRGTRATPGRRRAHRAPARAARSRHRGRCRPEVMRRATTASMSTAVSTSGPNCSACAANCSAVRSCSVTPVALAREHEPADDLVRLAEGHALADQVVGEVGRGHEAARARRAPCARR